jgi:hypothetical protein
MARTRKPRAEADDDIDDAASPPRRRRGRVVLRVLMVAAFFGVCGGAFSAIRGYVEEGVVAQVEPPVVVFKSKPAWMTDLVARQLAASFQPAKARSVFDRDVLVETHRRLRANPWIGNIRGVRRVYGEAPGDTIEVDCDFRAPMAIVESGQDYWFVDGGGIKLPERFTAGDLHKLIYASDGSTNLRVIQGVRRPPPKTAGQHWQGEDLVAALELVRHFYGQPFLNEIIRIDVSNFAGRVDPREAQIVLRTRYRTEVRWGRPWNSADAFIEVRPERKMQYLRNVLAEFGRIDARQPWIDIRFDRITYPSPNYLDPGRPQPPLHTDQVPLSDRRTTRAGAAR